MSQAGNSGAVEQRLRHYQGERLLARDLQDEYDNLARMRELHVVALHDTWGISLGFDVQVGSQGSLVVLPGAAYDVRGRQLLLAQPLHLALPQPSPQAEEAAAEQYYELVMRYDCDLGGSVADQAWSPCADVAGHEMPQFGWLPADQVRLGLDVPLVGVSMTGGQVDADKGLDFTVRHYSQPLARAHAGAGVVARPAVSYWDEPIGEATPRLGFQIVVDTSAAGFVGVPQYFASLNVTDLTQLAKDLQGTSFLLLPAITAESATSFTLRLTVAQGKQQRPHEGSPYPLVITVSSLPMTVSWVGIEPMTTPVPPVDVVSFLARYGEVLIALRRQGVILPIFTNRVLIPSLRLV